MASICATWPWHISHFMPASRCLRCVQFTPGRTAYTRTHGTSCCDFANVASLWIAGLLLATELWQDMHVLVAGKVISFPGSGFVWHVLHSRPNIRCVLWL